MPHLVLSRKYRPQRFDELVGQEHVAQTLSNAISSGRIGHAYLFIGPRGTGKTTTARIFAKALNCERGPTPTPCGQCSSCADVAAGSDLDVVEMDAASNNGVDDVRALRDSVAYRPARSRFRVWIVDEVHMLSLPAFNAFLKTLEEPPPQAKFLFCTTEAHRLPETFTSRVQRLEFRRIDEDAMSARLRALAAREGVGVEPGVCERIASGALGGLRDAESLLEQLLSCAGPAPETPAAGDVSRLVTLADLDAVSGRAPAVRLDALLDAVLLGDAGRALDAASACVGEGGKPDVVLDQCLDAFRSLLGEAARASRGPPAAPASRAPAFGLPRIARSIDLLLEKRRHLREGADGRLVVEVAAVELARLPSARDLDELLRGLTGASIAAQPQAAAQRQAMGAAASGEGRTREGAAASGEGRTREGAAASGEGRTREGAAASGEGRTREGAAASGEGRTREGAAASGEGRTREGAAASGEGRTREGAAASGEGRTREGAAASGEGRTREGAAASGEGRTREGAAASGEGRIRESAAASGEGRTRTEPTTPAPPAQRESMEAAKRAGEASAAQGESPRLETVSAAWPSILRAVEVRSRRLWMSLSKSEPSAVVGDAVIVALPEGDSVSRSVLRDREASDPFREATREVVGTPLRVLLSGSGPQGPVAVPPRALGGKRRAFEGATDVPASQPGATPPPKARDSTLVAASAPSEGSPRASPSEAPDVRSNPAVRALLDSFGARVLVFEHTREQGEVEGEAPAAQGAAP